MGGNYLPTFYKILYNITRALGVYARRVIGLGCVLPQGYTRTFACDVSIFWAFPFFIYLMDSRVAKGVGPCRVRVGVICHCYSSSRSVSFRSIFTAVSVLFARLHNNDDYQTCLVSPNSGKKIFVYI